MNVVRRNYMARFVRRFSDEPIENTEQDEINRLAYMADELMHIKSFLSDLEFFSDEFEAAYEEAFERYRREAAEC